MAAELFAKFNDESEERDESNENVELYADGLSNPQEQE